MSPTRTLAFMNQKGGVGKTTTTVNIAAALARAGRKVGVIDLDPQAHLTLHLGVEAQDGRPTVYDLLIEPDVTADEVAVEAQPGLFVFPAEVDLAAAEVELAGEPDRHHRLRDKIRCSPLFDDLDFLLIDCPPSLGLLTLNALALAREVIVPMQAHFLALQGVGKLLQTVGMVSAQVNPDLRVTGIVLCMFEANTRLANEVVTDLEAFFEEHRDEPVPYRDCRVLKPAIRRNIKLAESPSYGESIFQYDDTCPGAQDYAALAEGLMKQWDAFIARQNGQPEAMPEVVITPRAGHVLKHRPTPPPASPNSAASTENAASSSEIEAKSPTIAPKTNSVKTGAATSPTSS